MPLHAFHKEILVEFQKHGGHGTSHSGNSSYLGNGHFSYHLSNPVKRDIAQRFVRKHKEMSFGEFSALLDELFAGPSYDEKSFAAMLIGYSHGHRKQIAATRLDRWLDHLAGWAEIDSLCQSNFTAEDMLAHWGEWKKFLATSAKSKSISKRRASLVLLTGPIARSADERLLRVAIQNIETLKCERDVLITKAISWLLRSMVKHHRREVLVYLNENADSLPAIAVREATRKLTTGRK
jgi:3-methyladenine DNA glycosylase AlkD